MTGCVSGPLRAFDNVGNPSFSDYYAEAIRHAVSTEEQVEKSELITIVSDGMTIGEFVRLVAARSNVSIVVEEELDEKTVTLDVKEQTVADVLAAVARRLGVQVTRTGQLYFLGELRPEDKGVLVRRVGRLGIEDLQTAIGTLTSENGRVLVDVDGLLVVGDTVEVLRRVEELIDKLKKAETRTWVIQLYVVGLSKRAIDDIGIDFAPALDVAVTYATASDPRTAFNLNAALGALLDYEQSNGGVATLAAPTFVVRDGADAHTFVGEVVPIPRRSVGQSGDVTTVDFDQVEIGLDIVVSVREVGERKGLVKVSIDRSRINGFVEDVPRSTTEQFETDAIVNANGVYLLGELQRGDFESAEGGRFRIGRREVDQWDTVQVWMRTHAIDQPVISSISEQREASPAAMSDCEICGPIGPTSYDSINVGASEPDGTLTPLYDEPGPILIESPTLRVPELAVPETSEDPWQAVPSE